MYIRQTWEPSTHRPYVVSLLHWHTCLDEKSDYCHQATCFALPHISLSFTFASGHNKSMVLYTYLLDAQTRCLSLKRTMGLSLPSGTPPVEAHLASACAQFLTTGHLNLATLCQWSMAGHKFIFLLILDWLCEIHSLLFLRWSQGNGYQLPTAVVNSTMHSYSSFPAFPHSSFPVIHFYSLVSVSNKPPEQNPLPLSFLLVDGKCGPGSSLWEHPVAKSRRPEFEPKEGCRFFLFLSIQAHTAFLARLGPFKKLKF